MHALMGQGGAATPRQQNRPSITLATTQQPHIRTGRAKSQPNQKGQQRDRRQADRVRLRRRRTNTKRRAHPGRSTMTPASDVPAMARPRPQRLTKTGCAHAGLHTEDPTSHTSSTRQPRTRQCRQQQKRPNDKQADHTAANTTMHQPNCCGNNNDHKQTRRKPANTEPAGQARVETGTASHGWETPWCTTPANDHTHGHDRTPQLYHYTTDEPTATNYFKPPAPRESASSTESGGVSVRHGM